MKGESQMTGKKAFNYEKRKLLENYLQKKVQINRIAEVMEVSRQTVSKEIQKGLVTPGDKSSYSADKAQTAEEEKILAQIMRERGC